MAGAGGKGELVITAQSAANLKAARTFKATPYCSVEIENGSGVLTQTTPNKGQNPKWNEDLVIKDYTAGQSIVLKVWDKDPKKEELLGSATVKSDRFFPNGSSVLDLKLIETKAFNATLKVKIAVTAVGNSAASKDGTEVNKAKSGNNDAGKSDASKEDAKSSKPRHNALRRSSASATHSLAIIEFDVLGAHNGGADKGPDGNRIDSIPIANGVIEEGGACDIIKYVHDKHDEFANQVFKYDAVIVRISPGQLSQGTTPGTQERFDGLMNQMIAQGKIVWSSPAVQMNMGAKSALVAISQLTCGLPDTLAYYSREDLDKGFRKNCAFQPRVIKQNRGSAGEGVWLCWLEGKAYCEKYGDASLSDSDQLKLMEMNDNHVEYHTVGEFVEFCMNGSGGKAGDWKSSSLGKYFEGGKSVGGLLVDQRYCPRIKEGVVRMLMVGNVLNMTIHKKPNADGFSAVSGNSTYTYYKPGDPKYTDLEHKFLDVDLPQVMKALGIESDPLPLLWTVDFIPLDGDAPNSTVYTVADFNCSCVDISKFQAISGGSKTLADVPDEDYWETIPLPNLMGKKAIETLLLQAERVGNEVLMSLVRVTQVLLDKLPAEEVREKERLMGELNQIRGDLASGKGGDDVTASLNKLAGRVGELERSLSEPELPPSPTTKLSANQRLSLGSLFSESEEEIEETSKQPVQTSGESKQLIDQQQGKKIEQPTGEGHTRPSPTATEELAPPDFTNERDELEWLRGRLSQSNSKGHRSSKGVKDDDVRNPRKKSGARLSASVPAGARLNRSLNEDERRELEQLRVKLAMPKRANQGNRASSTSPSTSTPRKSAIARRSKKSVRQAGSVAQFRGSYIEPQEVFEKYSRKLEANLRDDSSRKKSQATPVPPFDPTPSDEDFELLSEKIFNGVFVNGCRALSHKLHEPTKLEVREQLKRNTKLTERGIVAGVRGDALESMKAIQLIKKEIWDTIKRCEQVCYQQNSFFDDATIGKKFEETKRAAAGFDFDGVLMGAIEEVCQIVKQNAEIARQRQLEADMQPLDRAMERFKMVQHTMGFLTASVGDVPFESDDPSIVNCVLHRVVLDPHNEAETATYEHRLVALEAGTTIVRDPVHQTSWPVKIITAEYLLEEREMQRKVALEEAKRQAQWWGKPAPVERKIVIEDPKDDPQVRWGKRRDRKKQQKKEEEEREKDRPKTDEEKEIEHIKEQVRMTIKDIPNAANLWHKKSVSHPISWRKPVERRDSVDNMDLFDIIAPLITEERSSPKREAWAFEALDYAFFSGRSPDTWKGPKTPLRVCVKNGRSDVVERLLRAKGNPNEANKDQVSLLHLAVWHNHVGVCQRLLEHEADANIMDTEGSTPMFFVSSKLVCDVMFLYKADVGIRNGRGQTPLHFASRSANEEVLEWMGKHIDPAVVDSRDDFGAPAAYYASQAGMDGRKLVKLGVKSLRSLGMA